MTAWLVVLTVLALIFIPPWGLSLIMLGFGMGHAGAYGEPSTVVQSLAVLLIAYPFWTFLTVLYGWVYHREQHVGRIWLMALLASAAVLFMLGVCVALWWLFG